MTVRIKYKDGDKECFLQVSGADIEIDMLVDKGIDIQQIPAEEYNQGFRAKERE